MKLVCKILIGSLIRETLSATFSFENEIVYLVSVSISTLVKQHKGQISRKYRVFSGDGRSSMSWSVERLQRASFVLARGWVSRVIRSHYSHVFK